MTVNELLDALVSRGVRLQNDNGQLVIEAPQGALTEELRDALVASKDAILALLQRREQGGRIQLEPDLEHRHQPFPLTDIQQAYWVGRTDAIDMGHVGCHYYQEFESAGLDLGRLEEAFQRLIAHHDMLRAIVQSDGKQVILATVSPYRFQVLDLRGGEPQAVAAGIEEVRRRMSHHVFAPDQWPLFEVQAIRLDQERLRLHLSIDLLMIDAASLSRLIADWEQLYRETEGFKKLDLSFRDYVLAEYEYRETPAYGRSLAYWNERLDTLPPAPELPVRMALPAEDGEGGVARQRRKGRLEAARWAQLKTRAGRAGLTPSTLLCTAFAEVLGTWSRGERFTLNFTLCHRLPLHPQVDQLLGDFTTTILLEADLGPATFLERARRLHSRFTADMDHVAVSGVEVLRHRNRNYVDLAAAAMPVVFTSLLGHEGVRPDVLFSSNWLGDIVYGISQTPQVSLDHQAFEEDGDLVFNWDTLAQAYPESVVDDMFAAYETLLRSLADDEAVWENKALCLVAEAQLQRQAAINATEAPVSDRLLHASFEDQAQQRPDALAVIDGERRLSYGELDRRSLHLAHELRRHGAVPNALVAVVMEKGWEQVVAVLAILRSGAAYLPINADLPLARIHHLLDQGRVRIALTQARVEARLDLPAQVHSMQVDEAEVAGPPAAPLAPAQTAGDLAYTIFTSGSTGQPKGVMVDHRGALNTILDLNQRFQVGPADRVLALSSLSFDLSVYDIFGLLAAGGTVVLPADASGRDPESWAELIRREQVSIWNSVPALMSMLVEFAVGQDGPGCSSLRLAMLSGDWIPVDLPDQLHALVDGIEVIGMGGATEASIWSIIYPIGAVDPARSSIPYGKPMVNQSFHVLDERLRPCPDLACGELYIGGVGLAQGYWRNEAETAHRFVSHPDTGARLYRTGDLGRYLPDGNIELLGRADFQVKVQGHRIELGEIESVLARHDSVHEVVVAARADQQGQKQLVAYVVAAENGVAGDPAATWKAHLEAHLPRYMVPAFFISLPALPLTANGKVDRGRLPEPEVARPAGARPEDGRQDGIEQVLSEVVKEVLELDQVHVQDRFLDLGCTSVHVVQINSKLRAALRRDIPIAEMFNHPTLTSLADFLRREEQEAPAPRVEVPARGSRATLAQRRKQARE